MLVRKLFTDYGIDLSFEGVWWLGFIDTVYGHERQRDEDDDAGGGGDDFDDDDDDADEVEEDDACSCMADKKFSQSCSQHIAKRHTYHYQ